MPEVSVIIPVYNAAPFLRESVESVLAQTFTDWEMIIIDDRSTDSSAEIAESYASKDPRIRLIRRSECSGSAFTPRADGIKAARGELIAPLDADDYLPTDYLQRLVQMHKENGAETVYPFMYFWDGVPLAPVVDPESGLTGKVMKGSEAVKYTLGGWKVTCNGGLIPKRTYMEAYRRFGDAHRDMSADETLTRWLLFLSDTVLFADVPYYYRINDDSITRKPSVRRLGILRSDIEVNEMLAECFGKDSQEYMLGQSQLFHRVLDSFALLRASMQDEQSRLEGYRMISDARVAVDLSLLRGEVSPHLYHIFRLPLPVLDSLLKLRSKAKDFLKFAKGQLIRPKRKYNHLKGIYESRRRFKRELRDLSEGVLTEGSESGHFYDKYYAEPDDTDVKSLKNDECCAQSSVVICPFDGKLYHGGATDRLRGILSTYAETKRRGIPLKISWTYPFVLEKYLEPADFDWHISAEDLHFKKGISHPVVIQDLPGSESDRMLKAALDGFSGEIHVYSNSDAYVGHYKELYDELFKPSAALRRQTEIHRRVLGEGYHAFTFRFAQLLGDFDDTPNKVLPRARRKELLERAGAEFDRIASTLPSDCRILITSDSETFLKFMQGRDRRIYIVPGSIRHVDHTESDEESDAWMKMFVEQQLLMGAATVRRMVTGGMYPSGFPRFAAEVGGAEFINHQF